MSFEREDVTTWVLDRTLKIDKIANELYLHISFMKDNDEWSDWIAIEVEDFVLIGDAIRKLLDKDND